MAAIHVAFVVTGRRMDQILFPVAALLGGLSLLLMVRLPQELVVQDFGGLQLGLGRLQLLWLVVSFVVLAIAAIVVGPSLFPWSRTANKSVLFWTGLTIAAATLLIGAAALLARV